MKTFILQRLDPTSEVDTTQYRAYYEHYDEHPLQQQLIIRNFPITDWKESLAEVNEEVQNFIKGLNPYNIKFHSSTNHIIL